MVYIPKINCGYLSGETPDVYDEDRGYPFYTEEECEKWIEENKEYFSEQEISGGVYAEPVEWENTCALHWLGYELKDDETPFGGTSFSNETLGDFMEELGISGTEPMGKVNFYLIECGVQPIPSQGNLKSYDVSIMPITNVQAHNEDEAVKMAIEKMLHAPEHYIIEENVDSVKEYKGE